MTAVFVAQRTFMKIFILLKTGIQTKLKGKSKETPQQCLKQLTLASL